MNANVPEWFKPAAGGAVVGAVVIAIIGFSAGWVMTSGSAHEMAEQQGEKAVIAALTPICVAQFKSQAQDVRTTKLAALKGESSWARGDFVEKEGWATMPGAKEPEDEVADACASELMKLASK